MRGGRQGGELRQHPEGRQLVHTRGVTRATRELTERVALAAVPGVLCRIERHNGAHVWVHVGHGADALQQHGQRIRALPAHTVHAKMRRNGRARRDRLATAARRALERGERNLRSERGHEADWERVDRLSHVARCGFARAFAPNAIICGSANEPFLHARTSYEDGTTVLIGPRPAPLTSVELVYGLPDTDRGRIRMIWGHIGRMHGNVVCFWLEVLSFVVVVVVGLLCLRLVKIQREIVPLGSRSAERQGRALPS